MPFIHFNQILSTLHSFRDKNSILINFIKKILKLSPIPLSKNHRYDIQTKAIIKKLHADSNCIDVGCFKGEILDLMLQAAPKGQHFGNYIKNIDSLSLDDFTRQYNQKENYYFVAHK